MPKSACIFGSTGLIGSYLKEQLLNDERYSRVIVFVRKELTLTHPKLVEVVGNYRQLESFSDKLITDEYYCCLGTTIKKAKTREAFKYVDYQLPMQIAQLAKKNEVKKYCIVSSIGASAKSNNFYLRTKGRMEEDISALGIERLHFFRPSLLLGEREEQRFGEVASKVLMKIFGFLMLGGLRKYRAIHGECVAQAMIAIANKDITQKVFISDEIEAISNEKT